MMGHETFSDELLNAYVDGELDAEERRRIETAMQQDSGLRERVEALQDLKQLVRSAYVHETTERAAAGTWRMPSIVGVAASVAAFALGVALTWGWYSYTDGPPGARVAAVSSDDATMGVNKDQAVKAIFHINRNDPGRLSEILNETEALLTTTRQAGRTASVRIIASGNGLLLFEKESAPASQRISAMKDDYPSHLIFNGCGLAYKQFKSREADGELQLLPEVQLVDLGVLELMRRQRQGWAYIRL